MNRKDLDKYIKEVYNVTAEFPWLSAPSFAVYRHDNNQKWFAVIMEIPKNKLGMEEEGSINVVNLKSDPLLVGSIILDKGIYPAYHMNKNHWITVCLDGSVEEEKIMWLVDVSFELTDKPKYKKKKSDSKVQK
ncbi:MAG: MmcQ/YjbR family DNA-binding protein [Ruminococcaceae bacterium]|nr:MmcQ/YjbR family DNA-binding protein [Oscillospiraceae bacterium]